MYGIKTGICKFKVNDKIIWYNFCLGSTSKGFSKDTQTETSLNGTVYDSLVDHSLIKKEDIPNIHQHLMVKNNKKYCLGFLTK